METNSCAARAWRRASTFILIPAVAFALSLTQVAGTAQSEFPDLITLPADFGSEGIAVGNGHTF